ncbi:sugar ABC transporter permease [bacterium]|nr:sugar ABC transporter permease [bacterium]
MKNRRLKDLFGNYLFILPALGMFLTFSFYPFLKLFQLSVYRWDGIASTTKFVGLSHFKDIIFHNPVWWQSVWNAFYITLLALILQNALALILALIVDKEIKGGNIYRTIFFLPPVLSFIVVGLIWSWIYDGNYGLLNHFLKMIGAGNIQLAWLANPKTALTSVAVIHMWKGFGWGFIILLAGLQNIPRELYEAARVDGANAWEMFRRVTVPLMVPVFVLVSILTILGTMPIYDLIVSTTGGGPGYHTEVPVTRILASMLGSRRFGYACSMGLVIGVILLIASLLQIKVGKRIRQE